MIAHRDPAALIHFWLIRRVWVDALVDSRFLRWTPAGMVTRADA